MKYDKGLIDIKDTLESSETMYCLVCLRAKSLFMTFNQIRCFLDGCYLLCLNVDDKIALNSGSAEVINLQFLPYFYNVNLSHSVIGNPIYEELRIRYGYPDFHLFLQRDEHFIGILPLNEEEYNMEKLYFERAKFHINSHDYDGMWSCRARSDIISILRIAEGANMGKQAENGWQILKYIRENIGDEFTLASLSARFHTNRTSLTQIIKELTGMSPMQYVLEERLNQSRPDLLFTKIPIAEISEKYGFSSVNYYIRAFKRRFGMPPLQYRIQGYKERVLHEKRRELEIV